MARTASCSQDASHFGAHLHPAGSLSRFSSGTLRPVSDPPLSTSRIGPYALGRELARGATGIVHEARGEDGSPVAVKVVALTTDARSAGSRPGSGAPAIEDLRVAVELLPADDRLARSARRLLDDTLAGR